MKRVHFSSFFSANVSFAIRGKLMLQRSVTRMPEPDDASKVGRGVKSHWEDYARSQTRRMSPTGKKARTSHHEPSKEANLIGNTPAIDK